MPCIAPPRTWPSWPIGFSTRPASWTDVNRSRRTWPVSVSTATSATCTVNAVTWACVVSSKSALPVTGARARASRLDSSARSPVSVRRSTVSSSAMRSCGQPWSSAASAKRAPRAALAASWTASLAMRLFRLAPAPLSKPVSGVSQTSTSMRSGLIPRTSAAIWRIVVYVPEPWSKIEVWTTTEPSGRNVTAACVWPPPGARSPMATPRP